jgi:hypothetical protein
VLLLKKLASRIIIVGLPIRQCRYKDALHYGCRAMDSQLHFVKALSFTTCHYICVALKLPSYQAIKLLFTSSILF